MEDGKNNRLTKAQRLEAFYWRCEGLSYDQIAERMSVSRDAVAGYCRRRGLTGRLGHQALSICRYCGKEIKQIPKMKPRKFCSDECRFAWWHGNPNFSVNKKAYYTITCANCGKDFVSYGHKERKYCTHACYIEARFGVPANDSGAV